MFATIRARWQGKTSRAYPSRRKVTDLLAEAAREVRAHRTQIHVQGAARFDEIAAYQPGLLDLHTELADAEIYLQALAAQARRDGHAALARAMSAAASTSARAAAQVATAATETTTQP